MWRSLDELGDGDALRRELAERFPRFAPLFDADRRQFLKLMSASLALAGLTGCSREPQEAILPYTYAPRGQVAGEPRFYASAHAVGGYAMGVLVESNMGRPTKIEGNPLHPASLGSTDVYAQASVLELWDPDRAQAVTHRGEPSTWEAFAAALQRRLIALRAQQGDGLRILTQTVTSPTLAAQMQALAARYPKAQWHAYEPIHRDHVHDGSVLAFRQPLDVRHHFDHAAVVLSLDADFLGFGPGRVRDARDFVNGHATHDATQASNRLYAITSAPTLTSAYADHQVAVRGSDVEAIARRLAKLVGVAVEAPDSVAGAPETWLAACAKDLAAHAGASLVVAGERQPPIVHALAHAMNAHLGNAGKTVAYIDPVAASPAHQMESLATLVEDMASRRVDTLLVVAGNPVYDAPRDAGFLEALRIVPASVHLGLYHDETSANCAWHLPATHFLEAWSDARAFDGTASIVQPAIAPLYDGRSVHEVLAMIVDGVERRGYDVVREYWRGKLGGDFEAAWNKALSDGVIPGTAFAERTLPLQPNALAAKANTPATSTNGTRVEVMFVPDASVYDGRYANNPWLQELPRPLTKITWDNAALVAPALAARLGVATDDVIELAQGDARIRLPVWVLPGHPDGAVTVSLGYGRRRAGRVGDARGFDAYALRPADAPWFLPDVAIAKTGGWYKLATTQHHHSMEGRDLVRVATLDAFHANPKAAGEPTSERGNGTLYDPFKYDGYRWAMTIDLGACIGCNACTIA
jgi:molybdopterin-containing oxidoreductase family iron-sulfur binding subunit